MPPALAPYLPPHLVADLAAGRVPRRLPATIRRDGALLLSDISGFTALTERLQARGRQGAEEVARVVNRVLAGAIAAIEAQSGSVVGFGGDALLAWFTGRSPARRAVGAAEAIRSAVRGAPSVRTSIGPVALDVSQAIHCGAVTEIHLGEEDLRHHLLDGDVVRKLLRLQERAAPGAIRVSSAARARSRGERPPRALRPIRPGAVDAGTLAAYVGRARPSHGGRFHGQLCDAAILFLETRGGSAARLQAFARLLRQLLAESDGLLLKADPSAAGTRWMSVFGIPRAHEEDAARASRTALQAVARRPSGLGVRAGIAFGTLVNLEVGTARRRSFDVMGDVVNTAARALEHAPWGGILVTDAVARRVGRGAARTHGKVKLKGKRAAVRLHALERVQPGTRALQLLAPLAGRSDEMHVLRETLARAGDGSGSVLAIGGEAGVGKSRLKWEIARVARAGGFATHEGRAVAFGGAPYGALSELLLSMLQIPPSLAAAAVQERLAAEAGRLGIEAMDRKHLAAVLGAGSSAPGLAPPTVRQNNVLAIAAWIRALARERPRLLVLEDLQWCDEATKEALPGIGAAVSGTATLLLLLHRPDFQPAEGTATLTLGPLPAEALRAMLRSLMRGAPDSVHTLVAERVEGNPLYAEEMVRHLVEAGLLSLTGPTARLLRAPGPEDLPDSLSSLLAGRLDRLPDPARRLVDLGAVLGRSFPRSLVEALPGGAHALKDGLHHLVAHEVLFQRPPPEPAELVFKHALIRDVAYGRLLVSRRRTLHRAAARILEAEPGRTPALALLGHHWEQAGDVTRAKRRYEEAMTEALRRSASEEAATCAARYLALTARPSRASVSVRMTRANEALRYLGRHVEAEAELCRALEEATKLHDRRLEANVLTGLGHVCHETGRPDAALELYGRALRTAHDLGDEGLVTTCHSNEAVVHMEQGRIDEARLLFEQVLAGLRERGDRANLARTSCNLAVLHQGQGRFEEAGRLYEEALEIGRAEGERRLQAILLLNLGEIRQELRRLDEARTCYEAAQAIFLEVADRRFQGIALGALATLEDSQGRAEASCRLFRAGIERLREVGDRRWAAILETYLGPCVAATGDLEGAASALDHGVAEARLVQDRRTEGVGLLSRAVLARRRGDLASAASFLDEAVSCHEAVADPMEIGKCACERVHQALAAGEDPEESLDRAADLVRRAGAPEESHVVRLFGQARRAVALWRAGAALFQGECPEEVPPAFRRALGEIPS